MLFLRIQRLIIFLIVGSAIALLGIVYVWHLAFPELSRTVTTGNFAVTVTQRGGERWLTLSTGTSQAEQEKLMSEWGPHLRTNLYKVDQGAIAIIDFGTILAFQDEPSLHGRRIQPAKHWTYLGTFIRDGDQVEFLPAGTVPECMDVLMDEAPPENERKEIYRESC